MSGNCGVCDESVNDHKNCIKCTGPCSSVFHATCTRIKTVEALTKMGSRREKWLCNDCQGLKVGTSTSSCSKESMASTPLTQELLIKTLDGFKKEMVAELKNYSKEVGELRESMEFLSNAVDTSNKLMEKWREEMKEVKKSYEQLKMERAQDSDEIKELKIKVRQLEQYSRRENIEISGIPETASEDVLGVINDVGAALGIAVDRDNVVAAHRVPSFNKKRIPSIVVRFRNRDLRDTWLNGYKRDKTITANRVNSSFPPARIYINEHLSPDIKVLLAKAKAFGRDHEYTFVWCKEGKIFIKNALNERSYRIDDGSDLVKLRK